MTPVYALSVRQPWAWLIVNGYKDMENRDWPTNFVGRFLVHAAKGMTFDEYQDACDFAHQVNLAIRIPAFDALERGGVVGSAFLSGCFKHVASPWFVGKWGFVLAGQQILPFQPLRGQLGFFKVVT